jgi:ABC-type thiamin/hydroxymethylpyrimidine transport system permease subunit
LGNILFFSKRELAVIVAIGLVTGILDDKVEMLEFAVAARTHLLALLNDYLAYKTGGPILGDLLEAWLEYGAVLAACLVRKPAAGTLALTINGLCQVFVNGTHDPHLLYGVPGLGADIVFASFNYRRYDAAAVALAGMACGIFWYPIVWFTHGIYLYPPTFIVADLGIRILGTTVGDGLLAGGVAFVLLSLAGKNWNQLPSPALSTDYVSRRRAYAVGAVIMLIGAILVILTASQPAVSNFFLGIGPKIPPGLPTEEEYNPGYVIGVLLVFLSLTVLSFLHVRQKNP